MEFKMSQAVSTPLVKVIDVELSAAFEEVEWALENWCLVRAKWRVENQVASLIFNDTPPLSIEFSPAHT